MLSRLKIFIHRLLHNPMQVLSLGIVITFMLLLLDGSLWRFWSLQRGQEDMKARMVDLEAKAKALEFQIHQAEQMTYIERQATDQFDYVREGDLIFVFNE
jgi:cell division protein FtsB